MARFTNSQSVPNFTRGADATPSSNRPSTDRPASSPSARTNKYGARCARCGVYVPEGQGTIEKNASGRWDVIHVQPCPDPQQASQAAPAPAAFAVPDGRYTVIWGDHYKTIRVRHQDEFDDFMPGKVLLSYLSGANNDRDYTRFGHVDERGQVRIWKKHQGNETLREAVKVLLGDPQAASKAYAAESGCCGVCGRTLTTPESLAAGIGPECSKKVGW